MFITTNHWINAINQISLGIRFNKNPRNRIKQFCKINCPHANNGVHNASWSSNKFPIEYTIKHDYHPLFHFLHSPYGWTENEMRTDIIWRSWWRSLDARPASSVAFSIINGERWMAMPTRQFLANAKLCVRNKIYIYIYSLIWAFVVDRERETQPCGHTDGACVRLISHLILNNWMASGQMNIWCGRWCGMAMWWWCAISTNPLCVALRGEKNK